MTVHERSYLKLSSFENHFKNIQIKKKNCFLFVSAKRLDGVPARYRPQEGEVRRLP